MFAALRVAVPLRLWVCVLSRFFALACGIDRSLSLLRRRAYGFAYFSCLCLRFTGQFDFASLKLPTAAALCVCF